MPLDANKKGDKSEPYKVFLENVDSFRTLDATPVQLNFGDQENVNTFVKYKAQWHKSCYLKFSKSKLKKITKKKGKGKGKVQRRTHNRGQRDSLDKNVYFCLQGNKGHSKSLHEFKTLDADENVRAMAARIQDNKLLGRIAGGDLIVRLLCY